MQQDILKQLDPNIYLRDDDIGAAYAADWSHMPAHLPEVVLRPRNVEEVSQIMRLCHAANQKIVTQGGRTGMSGGATPQKGEWVLSLERMNRITELDAPSMTISVEAGIVLEEIHQAAAENGLMFPIDLGARGSCTAGGIAATNAGGTQVIQYGMTRANILGLEAVLADGTILSAPNKLLKNNAGFDLKQLLIGSEGTLGIITALTFRLLPQRRVSKTALCAVDNFDQLITLLAAAHKNMMGLAGFEVMWANYFDAALKLLGRANPFPTAQDFYVLLESETAFDNDDFETALLDAFPEAQAAHIIMAKSLSEREKIWEIREAVADMIPQMKPLANFDIGVPISQMQAFTQEVQAALEADFADCALRIFGHMGDGNLHILASTGRAEDVAQMEEAVFTLTHKYGGSIAAEHGIGMVKKPWLADTRNPTQLAMMRQLKQMLDPKNILNAGRVVDGE